MDDLMGQVTDQQDIFKKILSKVPGFSGYIERENRRAADKLLREVVAQRYEEQWRRISELQRTAISAGEIKFVDDLESAAIKLRQFIDRIKTAAYGYSGLFDAQKINQEELAMMYQHDQALLESIDTLANAIDNVESSFNTEGISAAIRNLTSVSQQCVDAFNRRSQVFMRGIDESQ